MANISYCVTVYNFTSESLGSGGYNGCVVNTKSWTEQCLLRDAIFIFIPPLDDDQECDEYEFEVTAVSPLGRGPPSYRIRANLAYPGKLGTTSYGDLASTEEEMNVLVTTKLSTIVIIATISAVTLCKQALCS